MRFPLPAFRHVALLTILTGICALPVAAQEKNYLLFPVTTEYQRQVSPGGNYSIYGILNAPAFFRDGKLDEASSDLTALRKELAEMAKQHPGSAIFYLRGSADSPTADMRDALVAKVKQQAKEAGLERCSVGHTSDRDPWSEELRKLAAEELDENATEPGVREGGVRVYPIRTPLSSWTTSGASCVATIQQPFDRNTRTVSAADRKSMERCIAQLPEHARFKLLIAIQSTTAGSDHVDRFCEQRIDDPESAIYLAQDLGYATSSVRHSPCGGDPESLLQQPAPDFQLSTASGEEFSFQSQRADRVTLLTFWGIACGPCRVEIPYLKNLETNLGSQGFQVVAVNAYNETPDEIARFVEASKVNYTVLVQGKAVASKTYKVGACPTAFLVDREGRVVNYYIGFDEGDEQTLEARIRELLPARQKPRE